jgi:RNA polymerase sigma-70 factor (ECF subfamily)
LGSVTAENQPEILIDHLFRRQAGRMVAHLTRLLGPANLHIAEESVQDAMVRAMQMWPHTGVPENPAGWLFQVAHNAAIDAVRRGRFLDRKTDAVVGELMRSASTKPGDPDVEEQLRDDELRMILMCCHPTLSRDTSVALSLKTVGGFSVREIARAFLADEAAIAQRLVRAKRQIRDAGLTFEVPRGPDVHDRLDAMLDVIYFIFNEGYTAHEGDRLIRDDLCREALRLGLLVASSSLSRPRIHALVALMAFQAARLPARVDETGDLILLEDQDRNLWDRSLIALGFRHFDLCIAGDRVSAYHVQAAIGATYARAAAEEHVDWPRILELYDDLLARNPSPIIALNRAVAVAKVHGAAAALQAIEPLQADPKVRHYYLLLALRGHLFAATGSAAEAAACFRSALDCRCSEPERRFLRRKLLECERAAGRLPA